MFSGAVLSGLARVAAGGTRRGLVLWRSALRSDCTPMLTPRSRRRTLYARFARCVQTVAPRWLTKRAARADLGPALLVATEVAPTGYHLPRGNRVGSSTDPPTLPRKGVPGQAGARLWSAEKRRARGPRAQRASTTDSSQLFERSERSERSEFCDGAARPSIAGQSARSADRSSEARRPARARLCRATS
jgi:hypothetical protein